MVPFHTHLHTWMNLHFLCCKEEKTSVCELYWEGFLPAAMSSSTLIAGLQNLSVCAVMVSAVRAGNRFIETLLCYSLLPFTKQHFSIWREVFISAETIILFLILFLFWTVSVQNLSLLHGLSGTKGPNLNREFGCLSTQYLKPMYVFRILMSIISQD